ncbi:MAG: hypothetical protein CVU55_01450 [Deltaproteobacteria bacterium HGW-Deltaproteobacteria-13]|jgi:hypothetical protein|nr:MAG: hypothetical protein CVU55_01450 [Deltaproteobacteria bacterium HGW-Deltaproteobacteria-13]
MNVKGIIYLTGKTTIIKVFGEEPWNVFIAKLGAKDKFFNNMIMSVTPVPLDKFIFFLDELVKEFFNNDMMQYVTFGKVAAQYALSPDGIYKSYLLTKDTKQFIESVMPKFWSTYFDEGTVVTKFENNVAHLKITGLKFKHNYFEHLIMGYFQKALKIFGKKTVAKRIRSMAAGDDDIYYQFEIKES